MSLYDDTLKKNNNQQKKNFLLLNSVWLRICKLLLLFFLIFQTGRLVFILDVADRIMFKVCPLATAGIVVGSIYWTAVTYGAVTVMQVLLLF